MYKRHTGQVSMLESSEMFGTLPLEYSSAAERLLNCRRTPPQKEAPASFALSFLLAPNCDSGVAERG